MSVGGTDPLIGRLIDGRYRVSSRVARGGMATVYMATDLRLDRTVAVKVMHGHLADDHQFKQRFIQEARSAARLAHPNVVNVFDQGQDDATESAYLVMEYLPGITLRDLLHEYGALTPAQTVDIAEAVLSGLAAAHKAGIVHRDLKPENVLLADDGRIKIGDFGLARAVSANTATGAALLGTIAYLSPELVTRGVADARSDIYAVGIMMYEMLTGEQPYKGEQPMQIAYQHANDQVPPPSLRSPRIPPALDDLVLWATARDPERRPADAKVMLDELTETTRDIGPAAPGAQKTLVLPAPAAPRRTGPQPRRTGPQPRTAAADAETAVIGARGAAPTALYTETTAVPAASGSGRPPSPRSSAATAELAGLPASVGALQKTAKRRRKRAWIIPLVILVVLALAAGAGYWFAFGPGAPIAVPSVANLDPDAARQKLVAEGFHVAETPTTDTSTEIAKGRVIDTDPSSGTRVAKGSPLTLIVSDGPKLIAVPELAGNSADAARALVTQHWTATENQHEFSATVAKDTVIRALAADGTTVLAKGTPYAEKAKIILVVSSGPVPSVAGKTEDEARADLTAVGLQVAADSKHSTSDTVARGSVIGLDGIDPAKTVLHPNDTVTLIVSDGPPPVPVPAIVGQTWAKAKAALDAVGLSYKFADGVSQALASLLPNGSTVKTVNPAAGATAHKGDTVTISLQAN